MSGNREWMYRRRLNGGLNPEFLDGLEYFIERASSYPDFMNGTKIKCPCKKCDNIPYRDPNTVKLHLAKNGFVADYQIWRFQGETSLPQDRDRNRDSAYASTTYHTMVIDHAGSHLNSDDSEEPPNGEAQHLYDMLNAADKELWPGCKKHSQLSLVARLMSLKAEHKISERCFDQMVELMKEIVPEDNLVPANFYQTKKLLRGMGLPLEKIDCCPNNCMLYWRDTSDLIRCKFCNTSRFKDNSQGTTSKRRAVKKMYYFPLTPRLQRLYASKATAEDMRWHASSSDDGVMRHPSHSPAWKHLSHTFPDFAAETRNVRLGLSTDGFQPFGQSGKQYSSWPVIVTPYNLPPWMCMKEHFMFLTVLVPGPSNPKEKLDVFLQPLISELNHLWEVGVNTYDISKKQNFQMRATLMWTISDFPAYSMLSGWSTAGKLACPHCMEKSNAFTLQYSGKQSWFDTHRKFLPLDHVFRENKKDFIKNVTVGDPPPEARSGEEILTQIEEFGFVKVTELDSEDINSQAVRRCHSGWKKRSIFWDLPYWKSLLIRHNLDVMHIEKNVFDNVFNTVMNVQGKTKDTMKSREELSIYCFRSGLKRNDQEYNAAHTYILLNCAEVTEKYLKLFVEQVQSGHLSMSESDDINDKIEKEFATWFKEYVSESNIVNKFIQDLAEGPSPLVTSYHGYYVNGYKFHTMTHGSNRATMNSGVCIKGEVYGGDSELDYYGRLLEVCELEYPGLPAKSTVLFRCEWFDPSKSGTSVHPHYKLVSINHKRRFNKYEPFILANQATQVYYCRYPSLNQSKKDWWAVCKIKARPNVEVLPQSTINSIDAPFQDDELARSTNIDIDSDTTVTHPHGGLIDINDVEDEEDADVLFSDEEDGSDDD